MNEHPYTIEELESLLESVVDYALGDGVEFARENLYSMGFSDEQMRFFGFPEEIDE